MQQSQLFAETHSFWFRERKALSRLLRASQALTRMGLHALLSFNDQHSATSPTCRIARKASITLAIALVSSTASKLTERHGDVAHVAVGRTWGRGIAFAQRQASASRRRTTAFALAAPSS